MKKYYRMVVENARTGERDSYVSVRQGASPPGWKCVGVCGFFELHAGKKFDSTSQQRRFAGKTICKRG